VFNHRNTSNIETREERRYAIKFSLIESDLSACEVVGKTYCVHTRSSSLGS